VQHTYLFERGRWSARGTLVDAQGDQASLSGSASVEHGENVWNVLGDLDAGPGVCCGFPGRCTLRPLSPRQEQAEWEAHDDRLGRLSGVFLMVGDSILSTGASDDGRFVVSEWMQQVDFDRYVARGVLLEEGARVSSWALELERRAG
jgi:hypothetical protein